MLSSGISLKKNQNSWMRWNNNSSDIQLIPKLCPLWIQIFGNSLFCRKKKNVGPLGIWAHKNTTAIQACQKKWVLYWVMVLSTTNTQNGRQATVNKLLSSRDRLGIGQACLIDVAHAHVCYSTDPHNKENKKGSRKKEIKEEMSICNEEW